MNQIKYIKSRFTQKGIKDINDRSMNFMYNWRFISEINRDKVAFSIKSMKKKKLNVENVTNNTKYGSKQTCEIKRYDLNSFMVKIM